MTRPRRKLTLLDAMILIAALAAGLAAQRAYYLGTWRFPASSPLRRSVASLAYEVVTVPNMKKYVGVVPGLSSTQLAEKNRQIAALDRRTAAAKRRITLEKAYASLNVLLSISTLALVGIGLRKPRPRLRRLARDPGWAGCLTATVVLAARLPPVIGTWWRHGSLMMMGAPALGPACVAILDDLEAYAGPAILAAWVLIRIGGRFRPDWSTPGWLTMIAATSWVLLLFKGVAIAVLAPL